MKVQNENLSGVSTTSQARQSAGVEHGHGSRPHPSDSAGGDHVELSSVAAGIRQAKAVFEAQHSLKVRQIAQSYRAGSYSVDANSVSARMLDGWQADARAKKIGA